MDLSEKIKIKKELKLKGIKMSEDVIEMTEKLTHKNRKALGMPFVEYIVFIKERESKLCKRILAIILLIVYCAVGIAVYTSI